MREAPCRFGYPLLSADVILSFARTYSDCYASLDLGGTWTKVLFWGPRGSVDPKFTNPNFYPATSELPSIGPQFYI